MSHPAQVGERKFGPEREPETSVPIVARPEEYGLTAKDVVIVVVPVAGAHPSSRFPHVAFHPGKGVAVIGENRTEQVGRLPVEVAPVPTQTEAVIAPETVPFRSRRGESGLPPLHALHPPVGKVKRSPSR